MHSTGFASPRGDLHSVVLGCGARHDGLGGSDLVGERSMTDIPGRTGRGDASYKVFKVFNLKTPYLVFEVLGFRVYGFRV